MKRQTILAVFFALVISLPVLNAQNNTNLKSGVYKYSGLQGAGMVIIMLTSNPAMKNIVICDSSGEVAARGTARINGTQARVDLGNDGFEIWTIIDDDSFKDGAGITFYWVRAMRNDDPK